MEILIGLFWGFIGFILPIVSRVIEYLFSKQKITGDWTSVYESDKDVWHKEKENVSVSISLFGYVKIKGLSYFDSKYQYVAKGKFYKGMYVYGNWVSKNPNVNSYGTFMFTVASDGYKIYGFWGGNSADWKQGYSKWILAKPDQNNTVEEMIEEAKGLYW